MMRIGITSLKMIEIRIIVNIKTTIMIIIKNKGYNNIKIDKK